jgi:hypothetical protein
MSHSNTLKAIKTINELLTRNTATEVKDFIQWFLLKKNKFIIYAGAGTSKSVASYSEVDDNYLCVSKTWRELLFAMYQTLGEDRSNFLRSASARTGELDCLKKYSRNKHKTVQQLTEEEWMEFFLEDDDDKQSIVTEVLDKLGPFRFAWSLRWFFGDEMESTRKRNSEIGRIVNSKIKMAPNDKDIYNISKLVPEIVKLPFRDIVTTNYDTYLEWFLDKEQERRKKNNKAKFGYQVVYNSKTLNESYQNYVPRLFYLHGRANSQSNLIFDKYDYANLFSQNNEILNYLVREFLHYGVLYVGFGLDDQTFDYMESQIKFICEREEIGREKIPTSYALILYPEISIDEKKALERLFNIIVLEYNSHKDVAAIINNINLIIEYTENLNLEWIKKEDAQLEEVKRLKKLGVQHYLQGELAKSKDDFEKALGYTMFWDVRKWENVHQISELRRRLALTRSKLKIEDPRRTNSIDNKDPEELIKLNVENAKKLIENYKQGRIQKKTKPEIIVEEYMLDMLEARLKYHSGAFTEALKMLKKAQSRISEGKQSIIKASTNRINKKDSFEDADIKLLETYYFGQCQLNRVNAMVENTPGDVDMNKVAQNAMEIHLNLKKLKTSEENDLKIQEFGNIVVISKWANAYLKLRNFGKFVDKSSPEKIKENIRELEAINEILEDGWNYAKCEGAYAQDDKKHICMPSPRWVTVKHRSRCRTLALIWFNDNTQTDKLTDAYKSVQKAIELTTKKDFLKFQHIRNLLEAVRLNALTNFAEENPEANNGGLNSAMCFAASYHYLKSAFEDIKNLQGKGGKNTNPYIDWILIQAYEIGSVWKLVFQEFLKDNLKQDNLELLSEFLNNEDDRKFVEEKYTRFGKDILDDVKKVRGRIDSFKDVFDRVARSHSPRPKTF